MGTAFSSSAAASHPEVHSEDAFSQWTPPLVVLVLANCISLADSRNTPLRTLRLSRADFAATFSDYPSVLQSLDSLRAAACHPSDSSASLLSMRTALLPRSAFRGLPSAVFDDFLACGNREFRRDVEVTRSIASATIGEMGCLCGSGPPPSVDPHHSLDTVAATDVLATIALCCGSTLQRVLMLVHIYSSHRTWEGNISAQVWVTNRDPGAALASFLPGPLLSVSDVHDALIGIAIAVHVACGVTVPFCGADITATTSVLPRAQCVRSQGDNNANAPRPVSAPETGTCRNGSHAAVHSIQQSLRMRLAERMDSVSTGPTANDCTTTDPEFYDVVRVTVAAALRSDELWAATLHRSGVADDALCDPDSRVTLLSVVANDDAAATAAVPPLLSKVQMGCGMAALTEASCAAVALQAAEYWNASAADIRHTVDVAGARQSNGAKRRDDIPSRQHCSSASTRRQDMASHSVTGPDSYLMCADQWALGLAATVLESPATWRCLGMPQRSALMHLGGVLQATPLIVSYIASAEHHATALGEALAVECNAAREATALCSRLLLTARRVKATQNDVTALPHVGFHCVAGGSTAGCASGAMDLASFRSGRIVAPKRPTSSSSPVLPPGIPAYLSRRPMSASVTRRHGAVNATEQRAVQPLRSIDGCKPRQRIQIVGGDVNATAMSTALARLERASSAAASATAAFCDLLSHPTISIHRLLTWLFGHPAPRFFLWCLDVPMARVGSLECIELEPPALTRQRGVRTPVKGTTTVNGASIIEHFCVSTGIGLHEARALFCALQTASLDGGGTASWKAFASAVDVELLAVTERAHEMALRHLVPAALPPITRYSLAKRGALVQHVFRHYSVAISDTLASTGGTKQRPLLAPHTDPDTPVDTSEFDVVVGSTSGENTSHGINLRAFAVGLVAVVHGNATDKLTAIFSVFTAPNETLSTASLTDLVQAVMVLRGTVIRSVAALADGTAGAAEPRGNHHDEETLREFERGRGQMELAVEVAESIIMAAAAEDHGFSAGWLTCSAFVAALSAEPALLDCFANALCISSDSPQREGPHSFTFSLIGLIRESYSIDVTKNRGDTRSTAHLGKHLRGSDVLLLKEQAHLPPIQPGRSSIMARAVDRVAFRRLLRDVWLCPEGALFLADRVFDVMDEDGGGSIDVREMHAGFTRALRGTLRDRATFLFRLFDVDGRGHMKSDEVFRMLLASSRGVTALRRGSESPSSLSDTDARRVLALIDTDGSGSIELDEFWAVIEANPRLLDAFSCVFGVTAMEGTVTMLLGPDAGNRVSNAISQAAKKHESVRDSRCMSNSDSRSGANPVMPEATTVTATACSTHAINYIIASPGLLSVPARLSHSGMSWLSRDYNGTVEDAAASVNTVVVSTNLGIVANTACTAHLDITEGNPAASRQSSHPLAVVKPLTLQPVQWNRVGASIRPVSSPSLRSVVLCRSAHIAVSRRPRTGEGPISKTMMRIAEGFVKVKAVVPLRSTYPHAEHVMPTAQRPYFLKPPYGGEGGNRFYRANAASLEITAKVTAASSNTIARLLRHDVVEGRAADLMLQRALGRLARSATLRHDTHALTKRPVTAPTRQGA